MKTIELNDLTFEQIIENSSAPVLIDFGAGWCPSCRAMKPMLDTLAHELNGSALIASVDVDKNPVVTAKFGIRNLPTFILFKNGIVTEKIVGAQPINLLRQKLSQLMV
jgi:thioredoxin 1